MQAHSSNYTESSNGFVYFYRQEPLLTREGWSLNGQMRFVVLLTICITICAMFAFFYLI